MDTLFRNLSGILWVHVKTHALNKRTWSSFSFFKEYFQNLSEEARTVLRAFMNLFLAFTHQRLHIHLTCNGVFHHWGALSGLADGEHTNNILYSG